MGGRGDGAARGDGSRPRVEEQLGCSRPRPGEELEDLEDGGGVMEGSAATGKTLCGRRPACARGLEEMMKDTS